MEKVLDISYNTKSGVELEKTLSNLYQYGFEMDGCIFSSWEGFIQSLKTPNISLKMNLWEKWGYRAWKNGQGIEWWKDQKLYWDGKTIDRQSDEYTQLITRSYDCLFEQNSEFRNNLKLSKGYILDHSKGKLNKNETLLTRDEYLFQLNRLRDSL